MAHRVAQLALVLILIFTLVFPPPFALACGPFFRLAAYTDSRSPDLPYSDFLKGRLGTVQPTYWDVFLFAAYRNLVGLPFSASELAVLDNATGTNPAVPSATDVAANSDQKTEETLWQEVRYNIKAQGNQASYPGPVGGVRSETLNGNYIWFYNCLPDAFKNARETLQQRRAQFGVDSPAVRSWLDAQDKVFENCFGSAKPAVVPDPPSDSDPPVIRADRDYQIAAAYFYAGDYDEAAAKFSAIAQDRESPWAGISPYLAARALIRQGTIEDDNDALADAEKRLRQIVADPKQTDFHAAAQRRLNLVSARLHPLERRTEIAQVLLRPGANASFAQDLTDYFWLLDRTERGIGAPDDLTDWILTLKDNSPDSAKEAFARWEKTPSIPWLVAALIKATPDRPEVPRLLSDADKVPPSSPAYFTVKFHTLRLMAGQGKSSLVLTELDRLLGADSNSMPLSVHNQFFALRLSLARDLAEFLRFAPRRPVAIGYDYGLGGEEPSFERGLAEDASKAPPNFDADAATILSEKLPLALLVKAAKSDSLPAELRRSVALGAWTRAVLLEDQSAAQDLLPVVISLAPELKPALESFSTAVSADERTFAASYAILRSPGLRPFIEANVGRDTPTQELDNFRNNWWCSLAPQTPGANKPGVYSSYPWRSLSSALKQIYPQGTIPTPAFLTTEEQHAAAAELEKLSGLPPAPNWLAEQVFRFAKSHPDHPRVPEALHVVVTAGHLGCNDDATAGFSKSAFELLHKDYPSSEWAKKTPYWYK